VVTPTVLFGTSTLPISKTQLSQLDGVQRKMLRSIAGWARHSDEEWADTMRRVNWKVEKALTDFPVEKWSTQHARRQFWLARRFADGIDKWPARLAAWCPDKWPDGQIQLKRSRGRPRRKWDDYLQEFSCMHFAKPWYEVAAHEWLDREQHFAELVA
jgi:hypothetical protein